MTTREIIRATSLPVDPETAFSWHAHPDAMVRLSPPWAMPQNIRRTGGIAAGATVHMRVPAGPFHLPWKGRHVASTPPHLFRDVQEKGPFAFWEHTHRFEKTPNGCRMEDHLRYRLPLGIPGDLMAGRLVEKQLEALFSYRHNVLSDDLTANHPDPPLTILMSGTGGLVAEALIPALTTAGHRVIPLLRHASAGDGRQWDLSCKALSSGILDGIDAVIHLAGEPIGEDRWDAAKRSRIVESRIRGTRLLAEAIQRAAKPPRVFLSASAIGYYGDRKDAPLTETDPSGDLFISEVCRLWEREAMAAADTCRTVCMRIGVGLTPIGGALSRLLPLYHTGLGGTIGKGSAWMSWIAMEDLVRAIRFLLTAKELAGPVNLTAPCPVTAKDFATILGSTLRRPAVCRMPPALIRMALGQMGEEILLSGARVLPRKLMQAGFSFRYPHLTSALPALLGIHPPGARTP